MGFLDEVAGSNVDALISFLGSGSGRKRSTDDFLGWLVNRQGANTGAANSNRRNQWLGAPPKPQANAGQGPYAGFSGTPVSSGNTGGGVPKSIPNFVERVPTEDVIDHSSRDSFIQSMMPYATVAQMRTGIPAEIMMAINLNEQGWSRPAPGNNYFGIKGSNPRTGANTGPVTTWENYGQGPVVVQDTFRAYETPAESYEDFANFLRENPRYGRALQVLESTGDGEQFIREVHAAGYATDPAWSDKIISIAREIRGRQEPSVMMDAWS